MIDDENHPGGQPIDDLHVGDLHPGDQQVGDVQVGNLHVGDQKKLSRKAELMLSMVTVLYAVLAFGFQYPKVQTTIMPVCAVWNFLGLQQKWNLFAPVIPHATTHLMGIVTLSDGEKVLFVPPHQSMQPLHERMRYNRYLKWAADYAPFSGYHPYLPQLCTHVLQEFSFPDDKAKSCSLLMELSPISNPAEKVSLRDEPPQHWFHWPIYRQENSEGGLNVGGTH